MSDMPSLLMERNSHLKPAPKLSLLYCYFVSLATIISFTLTTIPYYLQSNSQSLMGNKVSAINGVRSSNFYDPSNAVNEVWVGDLEVISRLPFGDSDMAQAGWPKGDYPKIPWRPFIIPLHAGFKKVAKSEAVRSVISSASKLRPDQLYRFSGVNLAVTCWLVMQLLAIPACFVPIMFYLAPGFVSSVPCKRQVPPNVYASTISDDWTRSYRSPGALQRAAFLRAALGSIFYALGFFLLFGYRVVEYMMDGCTGFPTPRELQAGNYMVYEISSGFLVLAAAWSVACLWDAYLDARDVSSGMNNFENRENDDDLLVIARPAEEPGEKTALFEFDDDSDTEDGDFFSWMGTTYLDAV